RTRGAIKEFQKNYGLKATGYVDKKTWVTLNRIYKTDFISREKIDVRYIQIALKNAGFNPGPIDGKMGPKTEKAIREFQKAKVLVPDGLVGPKTWNELREYIKK
ncbi:MAG: peptidoglycan-binding protein, partial [Candidatus Omnitrophica bacterium]|nr:peptidoglycan-binding protein [Candidatus Omnitrophota bacterium]